MKKALSLITALALCLSLCACSSTNEGTSSASDASVASGENSTADTSTESSATESSSTESTATESSSTESTATESSSTESNLTEEDLLAAIEKQEVKVISTQYVVTDEETKLLFPDYMQAVIQNNSSADIKTAVVAFVAWDSNNLPVKIISASDFSDTGAYIREVDYGEVNMAPGSTFGEATGYEVDDDCGIATCKAIVVSYVTSDGQKWENPLYKNWCELYGTVEQ